MAVYPNPFVLNIIDLQNVITNIGGTNTSNVLTQDIQRLKSMVDTTTRTVYADYLKDFSGSGSIQVSSDLTFVTNPTSGLLAGITSNGTAVATSEPTSYLSSGTTSLSISSSGTVFSLASGSGDPLLSIDSTGTGTFAGGIYATGFYTLSDITKKRDIQRIQGSFDRICSLQPSSWTWCDTEQKGVGLLAQDVERVFPELIQEGGPGGSESAGKHINLTGLLAHVVGSIQTLSTMLGLI